jgi:hypothetical protein
MAAPQLSMATIPQPYPIGLSRAESKRDTVM